MQIPKYWSDATITFPHRDKTGRQRQRKVKRYGWSNESLDDAKQMAKERADEARAQLAQGKNINWTERQDSYAIDGFPIREEIIADHDHSIITRNRYGTECLNTEDVLIIDVDNPPLVSYGWQWLITLVLTLIAWLYIGIVVDNATIVHKITLAFCALLFCRWIAYVIDAVVQPLINRLRGGYLAIITRKIERFITDHPSAALNLYQTPAGFRLIMLHDTFRADDDFTLACFDEFRADENYRRMCRIQQCFRA